METTYARLTRTLNGFNTFLALQLGDIATTLTFLSLGVKEANPILSGLIHSTNPVVGLVVLKTFAFALGYYYQATGRKFTKVNLFFAGLMLWNLTAVVLTLNGVK